MTTHCSQALEYPLVVMPGLGGMPLRDESCREDAKFLYAAMARSTDKRLLIAG